MKKELQQIGLTPGESQVYEILVEIGPTKTGRILKKSNLASSKVYDVLQRLIKKGLANFSLENGVRKYDATPPERLIDFLEERKEELSKSQEEIKKIIPLIKEKRKNSEEKEAVIIYTGKQGPKIILKETIEAGKKGEKLMGYGTDEDPYKDFLPADIEQHFRDQKKYKIKWHLLFTKGKWKSPSPLAEVKYLPKGFNSPVRTMIYGDKVAIVDFNKTWTTIIIQKREIVESYKKHFEMLWKIAKK
ncbi:MAG: hypothetical protein KC516_03055 [Nanoarchaeota archaeon]|nr:hypothetical protein [Nanoarchaeota archaeon]